jgi:sulfur dioxygenase
MFVAPASRASAATAPRLSLAAVARVENVTLPLRHGDRVAFSERFLDARATPGHTDGCLTFVLNDQSMVFTADALWPAITTRILPLANHGLLYPGEDDTGRVATFVAEETWFNARLGWHGPGSATSWGTWRP